MDQAPSIETVLQAVQALYNNPDVMGKEKASVWLGELQKSVHAWQVADQLLQRNQNLESCYFGAQTMRTKIQYAFYELPQNSHQSLRDSLVEHASKISSETPPVIITQLSLALADLALQMPTWKNAVGDLIQRFGSNIQQLPFLLEVLTVLPEEFNRSQVNSRSLRLGANRRAELLDELTGSCPVILQLLSACMDSYADDIRVQAKVFRVIGSWFSIGAIPQEIFLNTKMLAAPFECLARRDCPALLHEAATDCICSALYCAEDLSKYSQLAQRMFEGAQTLLEPYHMAVAEEDSDKCINYCRIFTEMAESLLNIIVDTPNQGLGSLITIEMLLTCVGHHLYEVAEITFNFWYRLSEELYQRNTTELTDIFKPYIQRLIVAMCRHCQLESDHEGVPDEHGDFGEFRVRVSELIKDVVFIAGSSSCFAQMFENIKTSSPKASWETSEASLFVMTAVAKNILPDENEVVPQVVQAILTMSPDTNVAVRHTSTLLIGELCEWIERHPQLLDPVLQYLLSGLQHPLLASVAATALQSISTQCRDLMIDHFQGLVQIVQAMDSFNLSSEAAIGLLKGTATILARLPHNKIAEGLLQLCLCQISPLKLLLESTQAVKQGTNTDPTIWLDRLAAIFRYTNPTVTNGQMHPCQPVIMELWPVLSQACTKYQADVRIIERCCRCIRFAIRCLGKNSATLLTPLVTQMVQLYAVHQHSCFLYLGSILVDEYGCEAGCITGLLDMLQAFCGPTFKILEEHNGLRNHPDTVDDLFRLCLRFVQRAPVFFLQSPMAKPLLCCAIAACSLDHKDANASVMKFLADFIKCAREKDDRDDFEARSTAVKQLLSDHGQALVHATVNACVFCLPSYMVPDVAEVLYELMLINLPTFCVWLETTLKALPTENSGGVVTATHKQLTDFHKSATTAEDLKQLTHAVRDFSRLYR
ncbi:transportin-3-like isoform X1 [Pomacea canaliculata]|uniref:transportin-3-like isoform X1 n=1 Tax=Pomacea canaliculata TaxID=400727 RepID=UPI000D73BC3F|nr:transportin-3-like isoform X1 [Pomacea canaliculata]